MLSAAKPMSALLTRCQKLSGTLLITSSYNGTSYQNAEPANNPACAFKMLGGATFKISSNVILDNVIVFQENAQNSIIVP